MMVLDVYLALVLTSLLCSYSLPLQRRGEQEALGASSHRIALSFHNLICPSRLSTSSILVSLCKIGDSESVDLPRRAADQNGNR